MESMHQLVELERINFATIPTIELPIPDRRLIRFGTSCIIKSVWLTARASAAAAHDRTKYRSLGMRHLHWLSPHDEVRLLPIPILGVEATIRSPIGAHLPVAHWRCGAWRTAVVASSAAANSRSEMLRCVLVPHGLQRGDSRRFRDKPRNEHQRQKAQTRKDRNVGFCIEARRRFDVNEEPHRLSIKWASNGVQRLFVR